MKTNNIIGHAHTNVAFASARNQKANMHQATHLNLEKNEGLLLRKGVWYHSYKHLWQACLVQSIKWELLDKGVIVPIINVCYNPARTKLDKLIENKCLTANK